MPLRPLGLGELLDGSIKVIRRYPKPTFGIAAVVAVIGTVLNVLLVLGSDYSAFGELDTEPSSADPFADSGLESGGWTQIPVGLLGLLLGLILTGALISIVGKAVLGRPADLASTWAEVRPRILALVGLSLLTGLLAFGAMAVGILLAVLLAVAAGPVSLLLGFPLALAGMAGGVYLYVRLSLAPAVLVLEKAGVVEAMRRSGVLVRGSWWRLFGIELLTRILGGILSFILSVPFLVIGFIGAFQSEASVLPDIVLLVGAGLASTIVAPFEAGVRALLYVDRRMRAEGLDLTLQAAAAAPSPA